MIDIQCESLITLGQAAAALPGRPSAATLWRWRTRGVNGRKLEAVRIGGRSYTSIEALARFCEHQGIGNALTVRSPRQRKRDIERAEHELDAAGV